MAALKAYLAARLLESSSLRGMLLLGFGLGGIQLSDTDAVQLVAAGQVLAGVVGALLPDRHDGG